MFAATVAGIYPTAAEAMNAMGQGFDLNYKPDASKAQLYWTRYQKYLAFGSTL